VEVSTPLGERIAYYRRRRGLSQVKLAGLVGRSESWLSQVERGVRSIDRISVLMEVAGALNVPVSELAPDPLLLEAQGEEHPAVRAIRMALTGHAALPILLDGPEARPPDLSDLKARAEQAWDLTHASRYADLGELLPPLIAECEQAARRLSGTDRKTAFRLTAETYQATAAAMAKLRETDLAWIAGDRSVTAAERAGAALLAAAGEFRIAHAFLSGNRADQGLRTALTTTAALEQQGLQGASTEHVALWGAMNLVGAVLAIRANAEDVARGCMRKAEEAAQRIGEDRNDFHTEFGPTNVALHAIGVSVELGDAGEALRRAARVDASALSTERRARFLIDVARAYGQRRKTAEAVRTLQEAESLTPEQVRNHVLVREMVRDLLRGERRSINPGLRAFARRAGVLPETAY
jgi:transcriptional regulator with XRE-family HTH domain